MTPAEYWTRWIVFGLTFIGTFWWVGYWVIYFAMKAALKP